MICSIICGCAQKPANEDIFNNWVDGAEPVSALKEYVETVTDDKSEKDKVRTIFDIQMIKERGIICFTYYGDGFLQHMIRILTGTLLEVGIGENDPEDLLQILEQRKRANAGFMVPAKGLFLDKVEY